VVITDILDLNASQHPQRIALIAGERRFTFAQLQRSVYQLANALQPLTGRGDRVAILAQNLPEYIAALYAVPGSGRVLVMLNYRLHAQEWARQLNDAGARVLIAQASLLDGLRPLLGEIRTLERVVVIGAGNESSNEDSYHALLANAADLPPRERARVDDTACMIYTSGTTGSPKGVMVSHANIANAAVSYVADFDLQPNTSHLQSYPLCHASGFQTFVAHLRGMTIHLPAAFDPGEWLDIVERERIDYSSLAPTMATFVMAHPRWQTADISSLRTLFYGSMVMPVAMARELSERVGGLACGIGQSETTLLVTRFSAEEHRLALRENEALIASCGKPAMLAAVKIFDDAMQEVPVGEVGEMCVRGPLVMQGYWNNEAGTRDVFSGGWLHTGDLARRDEDGFIYVVDRKKDMIKTGGQNVYPRELENVLANHPAIAEVAVVGLPDPVWGENVVAVVVLREGASATSDAITAYFLEHLASFKKPKEIVFAESLPKNVTGKISKQVIREQLLRAPRALT
jgi:acyl-CoA synthetase (AMP-forming)/AMP-acid ligase II